MSRSTVLRLLSAAMIALPTGLAPVSTAQAGDGAAFVGGLVGGVILKTIIDEGRNGRPVRRTTPRAAQDPAVTEYWRNVQVALNAAGYNVGRPDGVAGRKTRAGVRAFQVSIGAEPTGNLKPDEYAELQRIAFAGQPNYGPATAYAPPPAAMVPGQAQPYVAPVPAGQAPIYVAPSPTYVGPANAAPVLQAVPPAPALQTASLAATALAPAAAAAAAPTAVDQWAGAYAMDCKRPDSQCTWDIEPEAGSEAAYKVVFTMADRYDITKVSCELTSIARPDPAGGGMLVAEMPNNKIRFKPHANGIEVAQDATIACDRGAMSGVGVVIGD